MRLHPDRQMFIRPAGTIMLCLLCCTALGGCKADTAPSSGMGDSYPAPLNDPTISVVSPELREWIVFQSPLVIREDGKPMAVEIPARNVTYNAYNVEYRILFYDERGKEISPVMGWKFARFEPKQVVRLNANELGTEAKSYRMEIRWSK
jgi:uncharacterized protein YcfL